MGCGIPSPHEPGGWISEWLPTLFFGPTARSAFTPCILAVKVEKGKYNDNQIFHENMTEIDPKAIAAAAEAAGKILPKTLQQIDTIGESISKTLLLVLTPFQLGAAIQDRLKDHIDKAVRKVPKERLIEPKNSVAFPIAQKLRFQEDGDPITEAYINLLARAMDGERVGEAHPAFLNVISQLAPDEIFLLSALANRDYTVVLVPTGNLVYPTPKEREERFKNLQGPAHLVAELRLLCFDYESLNQPDLFPVFFQNLSRLGLVEYISNQERYKECKVWNNEFNILFTRLTHFGQLFFKACLSGI